MSIKYPQASARPFIDIIIIATITTLMDDYHRNLFSSLFAQTTYTLTHDDGDDEIPQSQQPRAQNFAAANGLCEATIRIHPENNRCCSSATNRTTCEFDDFIAYNN